MGKALEADRIQPSLIPVSVTSMITEHQGRSFRSFVTLSNGKVLEAVGNSTQDAIDNALKDLTVDWSHMFPVSY